MILEVFMDTICVFIAIYGFGFITGMAVEILIKKWLEL